ncbi:MAG: molybdopterin-dependent oxidoreductase [Bacillus sp. (in: firmicutes)]
MGNNGKRERISQGKWTGVPLKDLLEKAGLSQNAQEIVFEGADFGKNRGFMKIFHLNEVFL